MHTTKTLLALATAASVMFTAPTQAQKHRDIVDTAVAAGSFKTLAAALDAAGLIDALKGKGPFTVFAPTDDAFAALPKGTVEALLEKKNRGTLQTILKYHVVAGSVAAKDVVKLTSADTLSGQRVAIRVGDNGVQLDDSRVVKTDIRCSNGIIHVIDRVLMPATDNIVGVAKKAGSFGTLLAAAKAAGLAGALSDDGPFTVFAPTDEAFAKLGDDTINALLQKKNRAQLQRILKYHVVSGRAFGTDVVGAAPAKTLAGDTVAFSLRDGRLSVNDSTVVANDIQATNGVVHVIDTVLMPPKPRPTGRKIVGVYLDEPSDVLSSQLGLSGKGLVITRVTKDSARDAGLRKFDVIAEIDGHPATRKAFDRAKGKRDFGESIELVVLRRGKRVAIRAPIVADPH